MLFTTEESSKLTQLGVLFGISSENLPDLDWAVIAITLNDLTISNSIQIGKMSTCPLKVLAISTNDAEVATCTGSNGESTGILYGSSTFLKMANRDTFEEVWTATLNESLGTLILSLAVESRGRTC